MENQRWQGFHNNWDFYFGNGLWKVKTEILVFMKTCHLWFSIILVSFWLCLFIIKPYSRHDLFSIVFFLVFKILECFLYLSIVVDIGSWILEVFIWPADVSNILNCFSILLKNSLKAFVKSSSFVMILSPIIT